MLKHVEQSVVQSAWHWFKRVNGGLAVYYEPHMQTDPRFRMRFSDAVTRMEDYAKEVDAQPDPEKWSPGCYEGSFQVVLMMKQALDAVGPSLLRQMHTRLGHDAGAPLPKGAAPAAPPITRPRACGRRERRSTSR